MPYRFVRLASALVLALGSLTVTLTLGGCNTVAEQSAREQRADNLLARGNDFADQGMLDSALAAFGMALEENPSLTEAHIGMGEIYEELGNHDIAVVAFERAVRSDPNNADALYGLGFNRQVLGLVEEAIAAYLRSLMINPDNFETNRDLASAYLQLDRPAEALAYAERAAELNPDSQPAWANLGFVYSRLGEYEGAVNAFREAAELGELDEPVLLGLGDAHIRLGNFERAENVLRQLVREHPSSTAHERLGVALFKQHLFDQALEQYGLSIVLNPEEVAALNGTGACLMTKYIQEGRADRSLRDAAIANWRRSLQINPGQPQIADLLARFSRI